MKTLLLFRHAKSSWDDPTLADEDRPLAPRGEKAAPRMGAYMVKAKLVPDLVICSPAARAQATWALAASKMKTPPPVRVLRSLYPGAPSTYLARIHAAPNEVDTLALVGHSPGIERLALHLLAGGRKKAVATLAEKFPTGALAVLEFDVARWKDVLPTTGLLTRMVRPRDLK